MRKACGLFLQKQKTSPRACSSVLLNSMKRLLIRFDMKSADILRIGRHSSPKHIQEISRDRFRKNLTKDEHKKFRKKLDVIKKQYERYGSRRGLTALNHHMAISQVNNLEEEFFTLRDKMKAEIDAKNQGEIL